MQFQSKISWHPVTELNKIKIFNEKNLSVLVF